MRALLIGGNGFIGRHVAASLRRRGHEVVLFSRTRAAPTDIAGDRNRLADSASALRACAPDVVVDLILSSGRQARELMQLFRGIAERVVALSSCDVYRAFGIVQGAEKGPLEPLPITESSLLRSTLHIDPPGRIERLRTLFEWLDEDYEKILVEREILTDRALPGTVLRLPMVYGPGDRLHRLLPLIRQMDDRHSEFVFEEKRAAWRAPRGYVENVAEAIALATVSARAAGRVYNVAEPESFSELEWARLVAAELGWRGSLVPLPAERAPADLRTSLNLDQHLVVDSTLIRDDLGYREAISRSEAIRKTIAWERGLIHVRADG
jgi:nucleoside-diphosphate-sugar epimerase